MFISVFVRRQRPDKTYDDFIYAWYPDEGFGFPGRADWCSERIGRRPSCAPAVRR